ncbi:MAG TPA: hypothetical protein VNT79_05495, partial [Phycisphaerae bacterium]|nr:hypothetical protein [Phycisphaerae bacterium]
MIRLWRFLPHTSLRRHPVSVARERIGLALLALLIAGFAMYTITTRDSAIRERALEFIKKAAPGGLEVAVAGARFEMFGGITLDDVSLAVPYDERLDPKLDPKARDFNSRRIFSARSVRLIHDPWLLLLGKLRVQRVVAVQPTIFLRHNADTGLRNWQLLSPAAPDEPEDELPHRPIITLRDARAVVVAVDQSGAQVVERLDADVRPHPQAETGYYIEVRRYSEPVERTTVFFDPGEKVVANSIFVDARTIRLQLPHKARNLFDLISMRGEVRLSRLLYDSQNNEERDIEIVLRRGRCDIPMTILDNDMSLFDPAGSRMAVDENEMLVRMNDVQGSVKIMGERIVVDMTGTINNAPCRLKGELTNTDADVFKSYGVDVTFKATGLPMPEGAVRERLLAEGAKTPNPIRNFLEDYDPHGNLNASLHFTRAPDSPGTLRTDGFIRINGMNGSAKWFPYPLHDVHGTVRFMGDDVYVENMHGQHGSGQANINCFVNLSTETIRVELDIKATSIPLDGHLFDALPRRYQSVVDRFSARGMAHVHARLLRPGAPEGAPDPDWTQRLTIDLVDARARVAPHPYPIKNVHGRLEVDGDRIRILGVSGDSDGASMRFDGYSIIRAQHDVEMEMRVEANGLRIDPPYVAALPEGLRAKLADFQPRGIMDLLGTVSMHRTTGDLMWDLHANVRDATLTHARFSYGFNDVAAELEIGDDRLKIVHAQGRHGDAAFKASGEIVGADGQTVVDLNFDANGVLLDEELHAALPAGLKEIWDLLSPRGRIRVRSDIHATSRDGNVNLVHRTEIEPIDAEIRFRGLPILLTNVNGRMLASGDRIEIIAIDGKCGNASISLAGELQLGAAGPGGTLSVDAKNMAFNRRLREALPETLRKFVESIKAQGSFDLRLSPLRFESTGMGGTRWDFDGALRLDNVALDLGFQIEGSHGEISGRGSVDEQGNFFADTRANLKRAKMAGWYVQDLTCHIHTDEAGQSILVEDAVARMYDGDVTGTA